MVNNIPSLAGMSLTKSSLAGNNWPSPSPRKVWSKKSRNLVRKNLQCTGQKGEDNSNYSKTSVTFFYFHSFSMFSFSVVYFTLNYIVSALHSCRCIHLEKKLSNSWICFDQTFLELGLGKLFPARQSLVNDIPAVDRNTAKPFLQCRKTQKEKNPC